MTAEDLLTRTLREVTEDIDYPTTPLADVQARAGAVRSRSRRTAMLAAAAAVALVAGSTALWVSRSPDSSPSPSHELSSGPTTSPTTVPLSSFPQGRPPGIDYLVDDTYVEMGGGRIASPTFAGATTAALGRGGILVATPRTGTQVSDLWLVSGNHPQRLGCGSARFAITPDRVETVYWLASSCGRRDTGGRLYSGVNNTMGNAGPGHLTTPPGHVVQPVGILAQGTVVNDRSGSTTTPRILAPGTSIALRALGSAAGCDENHDVVSGQLATDGGTGAVVSAQTGQVIWRAPGWRLGQFSTDGRYVVAQPASGSGRWAILDASQGRPVTMVSTAGRFSVSQVAWDVDDTVLAVASTGRREAVLRFDRQGNIYRVTPARAPIPGGAYRLATRP
ncbi:MAG TPA: hypothetical protein VFJ89_07335 [Nocardioides sp.]|jgi:hypothetical protein|nr:hypothetical protein [Nocardioides sp.]